ncbi:MAG: glycosyltransferase [Propionibacterium sp.]|nr:glycosyltransferase [Propionibacterium sp.]
MNVVYLNSLFNPKYSILPQLMTRLGLWRKATLLVAPRGELDPGALRLKLHKKRLFLKLYRKLGLSNSVLWHASTEEEADHIRAVFGVESQIVVRENETSLPLEAHRRAARAPGIPRLLFASRLSPKKGLLTLLEALAMVSTPTQVEIIGEFDDDKYEARCRDAAQRLPEIISVDFLGALNRERVLLHMRKADVMALPTAGENFGHVIAEAMSESCPVMCSAHTPWTARLSSGGGAVVSPDTPEAWATALREFLAKDPRALHRSSEKVGAVYDTWRNEEKGIHVFQLARDIQRALRV